VTTLRVPRGPSPVLEAEQIISVYVRNLHGETLTSLAEEYGVHRNTLYNNINSLHVHLVTPLERALLSALTREASRQEQAVIL
jgi:transposase-like protein